MTLNCQEVDTNKISNFSLQLIMDDKLKESSALNIGNDLNISAIKFPKMAKDIMMSEELNDYLRDQLNQMKRENESLLRELITKETQLQECQTKIEELLGKNANFESDTNFASTSQIANNKIIEISKKLRDKTAEIEVYKSKCAKLENSLLELQNYEKNKNETAEKPEKRLKDPEHDFKKLHEKLTHMTNKWTEEKNLNLQLKNDLKKANKWLQQEVGDKFETLLTMSTGLQSNWRGRAQIICDLQQKNQELRDKLKTFQETKGSPISKLNFDENKEKYENKIKTLNSENQELQTNNRELKYKYESLRSRCKALENEYNIVKSKLVALNQMHENDQQNIAKLTSKIQYHNQLKDEDVQRKNEEIRQLQDENENLKVKLAKEKCLTENKSRELLEKEDEIQMIHKRRQSRPASAYIKKPENNDKQDVKQIGKLEVDRQRLLELTEVQNTRLEEERNSHFRTQQILRTEKQKCAKLEAKLARAQLDQMSSNSGYSSKLSTPKQQEGDLKDRLELAEENVKALTTRLQLESLERKQDLKKLNKILSD